MGVWECGSVGVWVCGCVGVWECGSVGVWGCGSVGVWGLDICPGPSSVILMLYLPHCFPHNKHFSIHFPIKRNKKGT